MGPLPQAPTVGLQRSLVKVVQSCPTLGDPMACKAPGFSVHGISPGKNTGVGCLFLLQRVFPTQGSNLGLLWCGRILYCLSHEGRPQLSQVSKLNLSCFRRGWHFPHCGHRRPVRPPRLRRAGRPGSHRAWFTRASVHRKSAPGFAQRLKPRYPGDAPPDQVSARAPREDPGLAR